MLICHDLYFKTLKLIGTIALTETTAKSSLNVSAWILGFHILTAAEEQVVIFYHCVYYLHYHVSCTMLYSST